MKIFWTKSAEQDRAKIFDYIAEENPRAALEMDERFQEMVAQLADFPELGKLGLIAGTRELTLHNSYRLVYEVGQDTVWILAVVHTARQWPPINSKN